MGDLLAGCPESRKVFQDDMSLDAGNALQAAVSTILGIKLAETPNFIKEEGGYAISLQRFLDQASSGLAFQKVGLVNGRLPFGGLPGTRCVWAAGSPRGDFKHCVVGIISSEDPKVLTCWHDPHPDGTGTTRFITVFQALLLLQASSCLLGLTPHKDAWVGFFVASEPADAFISQKL